MVNYLTWYRISSQISGWVPNLWTVLGRCRIFGQTGYLNLYLAGYRISNKDGNPVLPKFIFICIIYFLYNNYKKKKVIYAVQKCCQINRGKMYIQCNVIWITLQFFLVYIMFRLWTLLREYKKIYFYIYTYVTFGCGCLFDVFTLFYPLVQHFWHPVQT